MKCSWVHVFTLCLSVLAVDARAALISIDPLATGSIRQQLTCGSPGCFALSYSSTNPLGNLNFFFATTIGSTTGFNSLGYLVYDLGAIADTAQSAKLEVDIQYLTPADPSLKINMLNNGTATALAAHPAGTQGAAIDLSDPTNTPALYGVLAGQYATLGSGLEAGAADLLGPINQVLSIDLSAATVDLINSSDGLFALGINWTANTGNQFPSGSDMLSFNTTPRLILTVPAASMVAPSTIWLVAAALLLAARAPHRASSALAAPIRAQRS